MSSFSTVLSWCGHEVRWYFMQHYTKPWWWDLSLALEAKSLVFSAFWKNSAASCLRFPPVGANIIKGMCLGHLFLGLGRWVFVFFPLSVDSFSWRETVQMEKTFSLLWHFWFTTSLITHPLWGAGRTLPVQWFTFHQLHCRCVLWRICFLSSKVPIALSNGRGLLTFNKVTILKSKILSR